MGLTLAGGDNLIHRELTVELSENHYVSRVNLDYPEQSLVLSMPLYEVPPDDHPVSVFANKDDPDYQTLLSWILNGAQDY